MKKMQNHLIGIDQGEVVLFSDFESGGPMWADEGPREVSKIVKFSSAFRKEPSVTVRLGMLDMSNKSFTRWDLRAQNVTETQFEIVFQTWADSKIARVRVAWQAIGEVAHDDDWDIF